MFTGKSSRLSVMLMCSTGLLAGPAFAQESSPFGFVKPDFDSPAESSPQALETEQAPLQGREVAGEFSNEGSHLPSGQTVEVTSFGQIDLHVKDLDITKVLQLLSIQAQRNIIATRSVSGTVSADLYQVDFYDAMDAILHPNGFGYEQKGNFIYVYTAEELERIQNANRKAVNVVHHLNYITAEDASTFVSPLLSAAGSIGVTGRVTAGFQPTASAAGENTNAHGERIVIRDYQENIDEILAVLKELDTRPKQVMVEATILEARLTDATGFGVDINALINFDDALFPTPLGVVDNLIRGTGPDRNDHGQAVQTTVGSTATGPSGMKVGFLSNNVSVFIRALDSVTDTNVIARPRLLALNRMSADLLVGQRLGYISTTATESSTTQTVEFLEVGTQLSFRAFISDDDYVRLELRPAISDGSISLVGDFVIPTETSNELTTNVIVRNGQTVVLGGLFKEDTNKNRSQVPGLGQVPILGNAFKGRDDTFERSEVIFLITPTIMKDDSLASAGERAMDSIERKRIGTKTGLLPWSREKQVTTYMHRALANVKKGDKKKALWYVNLALTLDPAQVEALRLKEELTGQQFHYGDRSIMEDALDSMVTEQVGEMKTAPAQPGSDAPVNHEEMMINDLDSVFEQSMDMTPSTANSTEDKPDTASTQTANESVDVQEVLAQGEQNIADGTQDDEAQLELETKSAGVVTGQDDPVIND